MCTAPNLNHLTRHCSVRWLVGACGPETPLSPQTDTAKADCWRTEFSRITSVTLWPECWTFCWIFEALWGLESTCWYYCCFCVLSWISLKLHSKCMILPCSLVKHNSYSVHFSCSPLYGMTSMSSRVSCSFQWVHVSTPKATLVKLSPWHLNKSLNNKLPLSVHPYTATVESRAEPLYKERWIMSLSCTCYPKGWPNEHALGRMTQKPNIIHRLSNKSVPMLDRWSYTLWTYYIFRLIDVSVSAWKLVRL